VMRVFHGMHLFLVGLMVFVLLPKASHCFQGKNDPSISSFSTIGSGIILGIRGNSVKQKDVSWTIARKGRDTGPGRGRAGGNFGNDWRRNESYKRWESLPPERKRLLKKRMQEWERLSPEQRKLMRKRYEQWKRLSPEEQIKIQNQLRHWDELTPEERQMIRERFVE